MNGQYDGKFLSVSPKLYLLLSGPKLPFGTFIVHFPQGYSLFLPIDGGVRTSNDKSLVYDTSLNIVILQSWPSSHFTLNHFRSPSPPKDPDGEHRDGQQYRDDWKHPGLTCRRQLVRIFIQIEKGHAEEGLGRVN